MALPKEQSIFCDKAPVVDHLFCDASSSQRIGSETVSYRLSSPCSLYLDSIDIIVLHKCEMNFVMGY